MHTTSENDVAREPEPNSPLSSTTEGLPMPRQLQVATGLTLEQATDLLDWLENHNIQAREVTASQTGFVTVRWVA